MNDKQKQFIQTLDDHHQWPCPYTFKFILPSENLEQFRDLFPDQEFSTRESKSGKYTSITMESSMCSGHDVMAVYTKASSIPGLMSL